MEGRSIQTREKRSFRYVMRVAQLKRIELKPLEPSEEKIRDRYNNPVSKRLKTFTGLNC